MIEERTVIERLSGAMVSSDLSHKERICDVDHVGALGMAGRQHGIGSALLRLDLTHDTEAVRGAHAATEAIVRKLGASRSWALTPNKVKRVANEALRIYVDPTCRCCNGRGVLGVERQADSHLDTCKRCKGAGRIAKDLRDAEGKPVANDRKHEDGTPNPVMEPCPDCCGKGKVSVVEKLKSEKVRPCSVCDGKGKRPLPQRNKKEIQATLASMEAMRRQIGAAVRRVMRIRGDVE